MNVRSSSVVVACALLLSVASPAAAQVQPATNRKKALELYDRGKIQYDLGRWDQAIELWMQAYETFDAPEFLFNIAQAYRHKGDCEQGPFFYRRYLSTKPNAPNRSDTASTVGAGECPARTGHCAATACTPLYSHLPRHSCTRISRVP